MFGRGRPSKRPFSAWRQVEEEDEDDEEDEDASEEEEGVARPPSLKRVASDTRAMAAALSTVTQNPELAAAVAANMGLSAVGTVATISGDASERASPFNPDNHQHHSLFDVLGIHMLKRLGPKEACAFRLASRACWTLMNEYGPVFLPQIKAILPSADLSAEYGLKFVNRFLLQPQSVWNVRDVFHASLGCPDPSISTGVIASVLDPIIVACGCEPQKAYYFLRKLAGAFLWSDVVDVDANALVQAELAKIDSSEATVNYATRCGTAQIPTTMRMADDNPYLWPSRYLLLVLEAHGVVNFWFFTPYVNNIDNFIDALIFTAKKFPETYSGVVEVVKDMARRYLYNDGDITHNLPKVIKTLAQLDTPEDLIGILHPSVVVHTTSGSTRGALTEAVAQGNFLAVRRMAPRMLEQRTDYVSTKRALMCAVKHQQPECLRELVDAGFTPTYSFVRDLMKEGSSVIKMMPIVLRPLRVLIATGRFETIVRKLADDPVDVSTVHRTRNADNVLWRALFVHIVLNHMVADNTIFWKVAAHLSFRRLLFVCIHECTEAATHYICNFDWSQALPNDDWLTEKDFNALPSVYKMVRVLRSLFRGRQRILSQVPLYDSEDTKDIEIYDAFWRCARRTTIGNTTIVNMARLLSHVPHFHQLVKTMSMGADLAKSIETKQYSSEIFERLHTVHEGNFQEALREATHDISAGTVFLEGEAKELIQHALVMNGTYDVAAAVLALDLGAKVRCMVVSHATAKDAESLRQASPAMSKADAEDLVYAKRDLMWIFPRPAAPVAAAAATHG